MDENIRVNRLLFKIANNKNDNDSLAELIKIKGGKIIYKANLLLGDNECAEDVLNETFNKIWLNASNMKNYDNCCAWISTIARNTALKYTKRFGLDINIDFFDEEQTSKINKYIVDHAANPESEAIMNDYVNDLSPKNSAIIHMLIDGYSITAIMNRLHLSHSTIKKRIIDIQKKMMDLNEDNK